MQTIECFFFRLILLKAGASFVRKGFENDLLKAWKSCFHPKSRMILAICRLTVQQGNKHDTVTGKSAGFVVLRFLVPAKQQQVLTETTFLV